MTNLRTMKTKIAFNNAYYRDATKRESRDLYRRTEHQPIRSAIQSRDLLYRSHDRNSMVLDNEDLLGPEYDFITRYPTYLLEDIAEPLLSLNDLLNEVATMDQTLENNLLFTQHIHEDSVLFDIIYAPEGFDIYGAELFGDLGLEFNLPILETRLDETSSQTGRADSHGNGNDVGVLIGDDRLSDELNCMGCDSYIVRSDGVVDRDDEEVYNEDEKFEHRVIETADQTIISSYNDVMMLEYSKRYSFIDNYDEAVCGNTDLIGRKRNME